MIMWLSCLVLRRLWFVFVLCCDVLGVLLGMMVFGWCLLILRWMRIFMRCIGLGVWLICFLLSLSFCGIWCLILIVCCLRCRFLIMFGIMIFGWGCLVCMWVGLFELGIARVLCWVYCFDVFLFGVWCMYGLVGFFWVVVCGVGFLIGVGLWGVWGVFVMLCGCWGWL